MNQHRIKCNFEMKYFGNYCFILLICGTAPSSFLKIKTPIRKQNDERQVHSIFGKIVHDKTGGDNDNLKINTMKNSIFRVQDSSEGYKMDPLMNFDFRRKRKSDSSMSDSSSMELENFKEKWMKAWTNKQLDALNATHMGDTVNMVAARPWGVQCGDPDQHDMPWGSCMLAMECDPELRIYRGDYFCGRTEFVCCAMLTHNYDMYQGFIPSFEDTSLETDSAEKREREKDSKEQSRKKRKRDRQKRKKARSRRKKKMRKNINRIIKEMRKILNKAFTNTTRERIRKTKQLKKFVKDMKKQYKKDRQAVKDIHDLALLKIDTKLQERLNDILGVNGKLVSNDTFRQIVVNGTISRENVLIITKQFPELIPYFLKDTRKRGRDWNEFNIEENNSEEKLLEYDLVNENVKTRKSNLNLAPRKEDGKDYNVEYDLLYF